MVCLATPGASLLRTRWALCATMIGAMISPLAEQIISIFGALSILAAYAAQHLGRLDRTSRLYALLNLVGSGILTWAAVRARQMGLILVEGAWAAISLAALVRLLLARWR